MTKDIASKELDTRSDERATKRAKAKDNFLTGLDDLVDSEITASRSAYSKTLVQEFTELCEYVSVLFGVYKKATRAGFLNYCYRRNSYSKRKIVEAFECAANNEECVGFSIAFLLYSDERIENMLDGETPQLT